MHQVKLRSPKNRAMGASPHCEVYDISGVGQSYSVDGSSDAAFRCQHCSNLFIV